MKIAPRDSESIIISNLIKQQLRVPETNHFPQSCHYSQTQTQKVAIQVETATLIVLSMLP